MNFEVPNFEGGNWPSGWRKIKELFSSNTAQIAHNLSMTKRKFARESCGM